MSRLSALTRTRPRQSARTGNRRQMQTITSPRPSNSSTGVIRMDEVNLESDLVILVMGASGGGKSTLINLMTDEKSEIIPVNSTDLRPSADFTVVRIPTFRGNVCFIEFPETKELQFSAHYQRYFNNIIGIIFIHKVTDERIPGDLQKDMDEIKRACINDPYLSSLIVCVTTHWSSPSFDQQEELNNETMLKTSVAGWGEEVRDSKGRLEFRRFPPEDARGSEVAGLLDHLLRREQLVRSTLLSMEADKMDGLIEVDLLSDLVILVMGATGGGKSTTINLVAGAKIIPVTSSLKTSTRFTVVRKPTPQGNVCFIEVPEMKTKKLTFTALYNRYNVIGVIFVHKVIDNRIAGDLLNDMEDIKWVCRDNPSFASRIVCVTTHWSSKECDDPNELLVENLLKTSDDGWGREMREEQLQFRRFPQVDPGEVDGVLDYLLEKERRDPSTAVSSECDDAEVWTAHNWKIVVVMGATGAGKSNFIAKACNLSSANQRIEGVDDLLESDTKVVQAHKVHINGHRLILVDTPGFDDSNRSDLDILKTISNWLETTFRHKVLVDGVLYFHRINDNRMAGSAVSNLKVFKGLTGKGLVWRNVKFITTMWDHMDDDGVGETREHQLKTGYWGQMVKDGATVMRFENTHTSARDVLKSFRTEWHKQQALRLQVELVDQHQKLKETKAGQQLYSKLGDILAAHNVLLEKQRQDPNFDLSSNAEYVKILESLKDVELDMQTLHLGLGDRLHILMTRLLQYTLR